MTKPKTYQDPKFPQRAMVIVAHPDDIEFVVAGTVARWTQAGTEVVYVLVTSGDAGSHEPGMTREQLARTRENEQRAAAQAVGVNEVVFLGYHDGEVEATLGLRRDLVRQIRRFKPDTLVCFDPTQLFISNDYINHPDHRAVGLAAIDAVAPAAAMPLSFAELRDEGLEPHRVREVLVATSSNPDLWVEITSTINLKIEALRRHTSQFTSDWDPADMLREWAAEDGKKAKVKYAESFKRIVLEREEVQEDGK